MNYKDNVWQPKDKPIDTNTHTYIDNTNRVGCLAPAVFFYLLHHFFLSFCPVSFSAANQISHLLSESCNFLCLIFHGNLRAGGRVGVLRVSYWGITFVPLVLCLTFHLTTVHLLPQLPATTGERELGLCRGKLYSFWRM